MHQVLPSIIRLIKKNTLTLIFKSLLAVINDKTCNTIRKQDAERNADKS